MHKQKTTENEADESTVFCKGCNKACKKIRTHLTMTRKTTKCEDAYSSEELKAFEEIVNSWED